MNRWHTTCCVRALLSSTRIDSSSSYTHTHQDPNPRCELFYQNYGSKNEMAILLLIICSPELLSTVSGLAALPRFHRRRASTSAIITSHFAALLPPARRMRCRTSLGSELLPTGRKCSWHTLAFRIFETGNGELFYTKDQHPLLAINYEIGHIHRVNVKDPFSPHLSLPVGVEPSLMTPRSSSVAIDGGHGNKKRARRGQIAQLSTQC